MDLSRLHKHFPELADGKQVDTKLSGLPVPVRLNIDPERRSIKLRLMLSLVAEYGPDALRQDQETWYTQQRVEEFLGNKTNTYVDRKERMFGMRRAAMKQYADLPPEIAHGPLLLMRGLEKFKHLLFGGTPLHATRTKVQHHSRNLDTQHVMTDTLTTIDDYLREAEAEVSPSVGELAAASRRRIEALRLGTRYVSGAERTCAGLDAEMFGLLYPEIAEREYESLRLPPQNQFL